MSTPGVPMVARTSYLALLALAASGPALADDGDRVSPYLLFQTWVTAWDQDEDPQADPAGYGDPEHDPGVLIRRARIGIDGDYGIVDYRVSVGMGAPPDVWFESRPLIGVVDAYAGLTWAAGPGDLRLAAGTQKVPVSRELLISSGELLFQERAVPTNHLAPDREAGLLLDYTADFGGRVRLGAYNGNANLLGDDNYGVLAAARVEFADGDAYTTYGDENAWGVALSAMYNDDVATTEARLGADALVRVGPLAVLVEGALSDLRPTDDDTVDEPDVQVQTTRWGGLVQVSGTVPMSQGGLEIGARGELFDDATHLDDNGDVALVFAGASWRDAYPGLDVGLGYVHRQELKGRGIPNDTVRLWMQVEVPRRGGAAPTTAWADDFAGTWAGSGDLEGVVLQLDEANGGLAGTVHTASGQALPVDSLAWDPAGRTVLASVHTERLGRIWVELADKGKEGLCGWSYEEGRREQAITSGDGGRYLCWDRAQ